MHGREGESIDLSHHKSLKVRKTTDLWVTRLQNRMKKVYVSFLFFSLRCTALRCE